MNGKTILLGLLIVTGIYLLPSVTAKFAGSHTMERHEEDGNATGIACGACHSYIASEMVAGTGNATMIKHFNAYLTTAYANITQGDRAGSALRISAGTENNASKNPFNSSTKLCLLCHQTQVSLAGTHTKVTTRVCTDISCHGFRSGLGLQTIFGGQNVTEKLNSTYGDAHGVWLAGMNSTDGNRYRAEDVDGRFADHDNQSYVNNAGYYTNAYMTCLGCHTWTGMIYASVARITNYTINVSFQYTNASVPNITYVNTSGTTNTAGHKPYGTVW